MLDVVQWSALGVFATFLMGFGTILWRGADRLNKAEARANEAAKSADDLKVRVDAVHAELVEHRINDAKDYVSRATLEDMESKLVEAINRLGDRLDKVFQSSFTFRSEGSQNH